MRTFFLLLVIFTLWDCNSKKIDHGMYIGIIKNGDSLGLGHFDYRNENYEFFDSNGADSIFSDKTILRKMPGQFVFGVKNKKGKPYRYLLFGKADTAITIGKNYLDISPNIINTRSAYYPLPEKLINDEYSITNCFWRVVGIHYDTTGIMVRENQLLAAIDKNSKDTILYQEEIFLLTEESRNVVGGSFAVFDNKNTLKEMKEICTNALEQALNSAQKEPK